MILEFTNKFIESEATIKAKLAEKHVSNYAEIVRTVIEAINPDLEYGLPDSRNIHSIDDGDYQGTLLFVYYTLALHVAQGLKAMD